MWLSILREGLWAPVDSGYDISAVPWGTLAKSREEKTLDATGVVATHRHGCHGLVRRVGITVLQRHILSSEDRPKAVPPDCQHETGKFRLGRSAHEGSIVWRVSKGSFS